MNERYTVYDGGKPFSSIHATDPEDAIRLACLKVVPQHKPATCSGILIPTANGTLPQQMDGAA